jgi:hypothetical protein
MNFCSQLPELYVSMYVSSIRVMHAIVPWCSWLPYCLTVYPFCVDRVYPCTLTQSSSHFCHYGQMNNIGSASANVEEWTLVNYLEEGGFPALLCDTLKDFGYTAYPKYSTREIMTTSQLLRCEVKVKISVCPNNPAWEEWECKAQGRNLLTPCRRLLSKHSQLFVGSTLTRQPALQPK